MFGFHNKPRGWSSRLRPRPVTRLEELEPRTLLTVSAPGNVLFPLDRAALEVTVRVARTTIILIIPEASLALTLQVPGVTARPTSAPTTPGAATSPFAPNFTPLTAAPPAVDSNLSGINAIRSVTINQGRLVIVFVAARPTTALPFASVAGSLGAQAADESLVDILFARSIPGTPFTVPASNYLAPVRQTGVTTPVIGGVGEGLPEDDILSRLEIWNWDAAPAADRQAVPPVQGQAAPPAADLAVAAAPQTAVPAPEPGAPAWAGACAACFAEGVVTSALAADWVMAPAADGAHPLPDFASAAVGMVAMLGGVAWAPETRRDLDQGRRRRLALRTPR